MQVGRFYEFYTETSPAPVMFSLKALKHNKRGAKYGFPLFMGERNAKRAVEQGVQVIFIRETGRYIGKIKERLPYMKISAI